MVLLKKLLQRSPSKNLPEFADIGNRQTIGGEFSFESSKNYLFLKSFENMIRGVHWIRPDSANRSTQTKGDKLKCKCIRILCRE